MSGVTVRLFPVLTICMRLTPQNSLLPPRTRSDIASLVAYWFVAVVKVKAGYDDSLDVFGIHGIGGIIGAVLTGVFSAAAFGGVKGDDYAMMSQLWVQIEGVIIKHPAVANVAVVAKPDEKWGETPCAFVVLKPGAAATAEEIVAHCRANLASFKCPRHVVFRELPMTSTGKVQKFVLREWAKAA